MKSLKTIFKISGAVMAVIGAVLLVVGCLDDIKACAHKIAAHRARCEEMQDYAD